MDCSKLAKVLRDRADRGLGSGFGWDLEEIQEEIRKSDLSPAMIATLELFFDAARTDAELIRVLARILEGKPIHKAFGAPGDFGYNSPIGAALYEAYSG